MREGSGEEVGSLPSGAQGSAGAYDAGLDADPIARLPSVGGTWERPPGLTFSSQGPG